MLQNIEFSKELNLLYHPVKPKEITKRFNAAIKRFDAKVSGNINLFILSDGSRAEFLEQEQKWEPVIEYEYQKESYK